MIKTELKTNKAKKKEGDSSFLKDLVVNNLKLTIAIVAVTGFVAYKVISPKMKAAKEKLSVLVEVNKNVRVPVEDVSGHDLFSPGDGNV